MASDRKKINKWIVQNKLTCLAVFFHSIMCKRLCSLAINAYILFVHFPTICVPRFPKAIQSLRDAWGDEDTVPDGVCGAAAVSLISLSVEQIITEIRESFTDRFQVFQFLRFCV